MKKVIFLSLMLFIACDQMYQAKGRVVLQDNTTPVDSANVSLYVENNLVSQEATKADGFFSLASPVYGYDCADRRAKVRVQKDGYQNYEAPASSDMLIVLVKN